MSHIKEEYYKEEYSKESPVVPERDPPSSRKRTREEKSAVAPSVFLTPTQIQDIQRRVKGNDSAAVACFDKLSAWKISKNIVGGNDYRSILKWVIKAVEEDLAKPKPEDRVEADKALAVKLGAKFPNHKDIVVGYNYVEFRLGHGNAPHLVFGDHGFREQVENNLRKMGLNFIE